MNHFLDIFFLAALAIYVIYRLFRVLGQDVGLKADPSQKPYPTGPVVEGIKNLHPDLSPLTESIQKYKRYDPTFSINSFIEGAKGAFEMILTAYKEQDLETLSHLVSLEIRKKFESSFRNAKKRKEVIGNSLVRIKSCELQDLRMERKTAFTKVKYVSEQIFVTHDSHGHIVEGDPDQIETLVEIWTFKREVSSKDPNWVLVKIENLD